MSLLRPEVRSIDRMALWGQGASPDGVSSVPSALRLIPLYAATSGIADDISVTPWHAYADSGSGWGERLPVQPRLLTDPAGDGLGLIPWLNQGLMSALLWGFAFGLPVAQGPGGPTAVRWVNPSRVDIDETGPTAIFRIDGVRIDEYLYVPGAVLPGSIRGLSPVSMFRLQLGKSLKAQQYAADLFDRGIMPAGVLKNTARVLARGQADAVKTQFVDSTGGGRAPFVTGSDWSWTPLAVPDDDAQFLETIKAGATEIAAIYRVTAEDVGGVTGAPMTYSTLEMNQQNRNRRALLPWVRRFEAVLTAALPPGQYVKANMDALVRPDLAARMQAHDIALRIGMETQDEGRALEDKPPLTPEQVQQWQNLYGPRAGQQVTTSMTGGQ